jgi:hypothetical protein
MTLRAIITKMNPFLLNVIIFPYLMINTFVAVITWSTQGLPSAAIVAFIMYATMIAVAWVDNR